MLNLNRRQWLAAGTALGVAPLSSAQALPSQLRFAVSDTWAAPYLVVSSGAPVGGLLYELMLAIAAEAGARPQFVRLPNQRVDAALLSGDVDLHCMLSPQWYVGPLPGRLGPPMVDLEDVLVMRGSGPAVELRAQRGLRVGTVLVYRYESLLDAFASGALVREDAPSQQLVMEKLRLGRTEAAIVDRRVLQHFNRDRLAGDRLHARQRIARTVTHGCVSSRSAWPQERLMQALERVVSSGALRRLLDRPA